ncbi:serine/threonine/tyrosine-interacting-like protein 2 isoform X2 [Chaetodon trifascialis]|uniref:serine/threonine/tyrosine-interacting-like protein 2 isoform X2 n=1 Tax=Chaetodon trifascialis TaxID=109706 RepID=UPI003992513D
MASTNESGERGDQTVPGGEEEAEQRSVQGIQSRYLRCPSPSFSMISESRFSAISGSDAASIFMEPIHLSSAIAAKKIISEELPPRSPRAESVPESMLETAEQLMVEDLYNRVRDMVDDRSPYNTPCVLDIQRAMVQDRLEAPVNPVDEVWPNIFIGEKSIAVNKARLKRMGITHILNTAHGTGVYTGQSFYTGMSIQYMGIEVDDFPDADISTHFRSTAEFLDEALLTHKGKVLVVSMMGVSRSAVLVASYLMIFQHMTIMEALTSMRKKRAINPNEGFLKQLRDLNENLMEERDDDDETLSQCSVIDARARARIFGEGGDDDDDDTDKEEEQSMVEVKAHSIMMEEEEDGESVMSSVASSAAAAALRSGLIGAQNGLDNQGSASTPEEVDLPEQEHGEDGDDEDGLDSMIREWQRRNEKYQNDDWWEAQLNSDGEDAESLTEGRPKKTKEGADADVESITSEDVRAVKERLKRRNRRPPSDAMSTSSYSSYSDLWKQRLREIEEEAAARYRKKEDDDGSESTANEGGEGGRKKIEDEMESILSDTGSMYNFCQKNKEKMTPLERWRVKRIQFGWNKKDREDGEKSSVGDGDGEGEAKTPSLQDVNLTAYQSWKLRQQKRLGEENTDEILELSRGEDSATVKRRQRREELLERSKKTLEESQSMCGWETESCISGGTIPLSAFWTGAGVAGPPSVANDDNVSMLSGRSSMISSVSQARTARSAQSAVPVNPVTPVPPILPVPTVQGPGGEPMVNLASIQNWIANVVSETIKQKQSEMSLPPPSRVGSELSFGAASSMISGRGVDDDKASLLSGASYSGVLSQGRGRAASVLSGGGSSSLSGLTGRGSALGSASGSTFGSKKNKITTTSVPLFSLFQDQVNMSKLDAIDKEIKSEMRDKMSTYEKKKILEDNKRSTLYKKKKPKEEEEEEEEERKKKEEEFLEEAKKKEKPTRSYGLSGCLNLNPALEKDKNTSIDDWLQSVRPPPRKTASGAEVVQSEDPYDDLDASASEFDFSSRRASYAVDEDEEETYGVASRYRSRLHEDLSGGDVEYSYNGFTQSHGYRRAARSYAESNEGSDAYADLSVKRTFARHSQYESSETAGRRSRREEAEEEEDDDIAAFIAQTRQRIRARAVAEAEDDEVLAAWRAQQEARSQSRSENES